MNRCQWYVNGMIMITKYHKENAFSKRTGGQGRWTPVLGL